MFMETGVNFVITVPFSKLHTSYNTGRLFAHNWLAVSGIRNAWNHDAAV